VSEQLYKKVLKNNKAVLIKSDHELTSWKMDWVPILSTPKIIQVGSKLIISVFIFPNKYELKLFAKTSYIYVRYLDIR